MPCLLFCFGCCGTGVVGNFQPGVCFLPQNRAVREQRKIFKKSERGCRFLALHVAVREWRDQANTGSRYEQTGRSEKYFMQFQNKCRFGGSKVAVGVWEEFLRQIGSVLAPDARERRGLAPFWRQKAKAKAGFSRVASILMPPSKGKSGCGIKIDAAGKFFSVRLNFSGFP